MHSLFGKRGVLLAGLLVTALAAMTPSSAAAKPEPGATKPRGFRLFARSLGAITINRIYCGLSTTGEVCVDSTNSSTIGGGYWPKGTADQYVFNSGLQLAGRIGGSKPANPWGGDTTGAFFFDPKGTTQHGQEVQPIYNATNPDDFANWPAAAMVPQGDTNEDIFNPLLRGLRSASQGDIWFMSWEGNPSQNAQRLHPLGVLVETRGMGWNFPKGNEDILYFVYTFYNITSTNPSDYAAVRPALQPILLQQAQQFQSSNEAAFGVSLPDGGWPIENLFAAFAADMDVADAGSNYATVNLPFALGHTYDATFSQPAGWTFDPGIFSAPFFNGAGFVGVKYLKSPTGAGEIQLFSNTINGAPFAGAVNDPGNAKQLFRYLSGTLSTATGDQPCNTGNPSISRICFINNNSVQDMRFFQSSTPLTIAPGQFGSIVVAYIFAPPVAVSGYAAGTEVQPEDPTRLTSVAALTGGGANLIDSITGFRGYTDANSDGIVQQNEFQVVDGSLLGKANVAQAVFDNKFLLPFAPESPEFFLVPGDNQVTVLWRPSASEATGDPYFAVASSPTVQPPGGGLPVANALYDPNYRQFDVEGYRVYRGRVDAPNSLTLLAQFDYAGTSIQDFSGFVNPVVTCAPELVPPITTDCPVAYIPAEFQPGVERTVFNEVPLVGSIVQIQPGGRTALADGTAYVLAADTALTGSVSGGFPELDDTGVPFVYVDETVRNNFRYFYAVTAFDVNSLRSGLTNLESPRITKSVTPTASASNYENTATTSTAMFGRDVALTDTVVPTLDAGGKFTKMPAIANGWELSLAAFVRQLIAAPGAVVARLDSLQLGSAYDAAPKPANYYVTINPGASEQQVVLSMVQGQTNGVAHASTGFTGITVDNSLAQRFGGSDAYSIPGNLDATLEGAYYTGAYGRGCVNAATGFGDDGHTCDQNGARWFAGPSPANNETKDDPTQPGNGVNGTAPVLPADRNNGGALPGVVSIYENRSYFNTQTTYRQIEGALAGAARAADFNVYWGEGGKVDSVIDATHNVVVPFASDHIGGTWGILNQAATTAAGSHDTRPAVLTIGDWGCVPPLKSFTSVGAGGLIACAAGTTYALSETAIPGTIGMAGGAAINDATVAPQPNPGFMMYLPGHIFHFELAAGVPAAGTVWTMRSYIGAINGGKGGPGGDEGPYEFTPRVRTFSAVGAELRFSFDVVNQVVAATAANLDEVHTVPDPYYVTNEFEQTTDTKIIKFVNLPQAATIRIYSSSGVLVTAIEHNSAQAGGTADWNVRNRNNQVVASGVYFYHIEAGDARRVGRFTIVNFAQ